jgi:hypothetical protein
MRVQMMTNRREHPMSPITPTRAIVSFSAHITKRLTKTTGSTTGGRLIRLTVAALGTLALTAFGDSYFFDVSRMVETQYTFSIRLLDTVVVSAEQDTTIRLRETRLISGPDTSYWDTVYDTTYNSLYQPARLTTWSVTLGLRYSFFDSKNRSASIFAEGDSSIVIDSVWGDTQTATATNRQIHIRYHETYLDFSNPGAIRLIAKIEGELNSIRTTFSKPAPATIDKNPIVVKNPDSLISSLAGEWRWMASEGFEYYTGRVILLPATTGYLVDLTLSADSITVRQNGVIMSQGSIDTAYMLNGEVMMGISTPDGTNGFDLGSFGLRILKISDNLMMLSSYHSRSYMNYYYSRGPSQVADVRTGGKSDIHAGQILAGIIRHLTLDKSALRFSVETPCRQSLAVTLWDMQGRTLATGSFPPSANGCCSIPLEHSLPAGTYVAGLNADGHRAVRKMILDGR